MGHSSPKWPKLIQTVQYNLDGPDWFNNLVSQSSHQNSVANFFGGAACMKNMKQVMMKKKMVENESSGDVRAAFKVFDQDGDG